MTSTEAVRPPAHAGTFYESDPDTLRADVQRHLNAAGEPPTLGRVVGLVAPHAGHIFSGAPAAHAYRLLQGSGTRRVVLVAPSHREWFEGVATHLGEAFETPLGRVPLDHAMCRRLVDENEFITDLPRAHRQEHSLEVHLPFLQVVLEEWSLVPLLVAEQRWPLMERLGMALAKTLVDDQIPTVIIASSDLYHGENPSDCKTMDTRCAEAVAQFEPEDFLAGAEVYSYQACGAGPIAVAMVASRALGATRSQILCLTNSGETYPSLSRRVVGYLSAAFHRPEAG